MPALSWSVSFPIWSSPQPHLRVKTRVPLPNSNLIRYCQHSFTARHVSEDALFSRYRPDARVLSFDIQCRFQRELCSIQLSCDIRQPKTYGGSSFCPWHVQFGCSRQDYYHRTSSSRRAGQRVLGWPASGTAKPCASYSISIGVHADLFCTFRSLPKLALFPCPSIQMDSPKQSLRLHQYCSTARLRK